MEKRNGALTSELDGAVRMALSIGSDDDVPSDVVQRICNVIEAMLIHGLRDAFFVKGSRYAKYPEPNFWPFLCKLSHRNIRLQITALKQITTDIGRSRAWVRIVVNEISLEHYLVAFRREHEALRQFYHRCAYLRDDEEIERMLGHLRALSKLSIKAPVNSALLNVWTPTPLILAGLISGKPVRVHQLGRQRGGSHRRLYSDEKNEEEMGVSAIEYDDSLINDEARQSSNSVFSDEDDRSSFCSHPSMLVDTQPSFFSSTPTRSPLLPFGEDRVIVHRRTHRAGSSASSSESGGVRFGPSIPVNSLPCSPVLTQQERSRDVSSMTRPVSSPNVPFRPEVSRVSKQRELSVMVTSAPIDIDKGPADTATSLGDELMCALETDMNASGNSLMGRAWTIPYHAQQTTQTVLSSPSVSEPDSPMANFDLALRSALLTAVDGGDEQIEETRVDHRDEEGDGFLATVNSKSEQNSSVIEVAQCSLPESADDAACSAARTRLPIETTSTIPEDDAEAEIIQTETVNGLDECGVPEHIVEMLSLIQQEKGLDEQGFRCPSCRRSIGLGFGPFRVCAFDARYYCTDCWKKGSTVPIPSRLLHGWDASPRQVARPSRELLNNVADRPLIRVDVVNSTLYDHCLPMRQIKEQREKLSLVALYLLSCRQSIADDLRRRLWPKEYLYTDVHLYSVSDLYDAVSGQLLRHVQNLVNFAVSHVHGCALCAQKGFICELCHNQQIIYPFQVETTSRCLECFSVFHTECLTGRECPKCVRRRVYEKTGKEEEEGRHLMLD